MILTLLEILILTLLIIATIKMTYKSINEWNDGQLLAGAEELFVLSSNNLAYQRARKLVFVTA